MCSVSLATFVLRLQQINAKAIEVWKFQKTLLEVTF